MSTDTVYQDIDINSLVQFTDHPFKLYEGQRFVDMVKSIRANGIYQPIIVRPTINEKYEILSGHNRVKAAREIGYATIPAVIQENLSDEDASLIVTETNLFQRSFSDISHSERAYVIHKLYNTMKKKSGYRTDLMGADDPTYSPKAKRSTMGKLGEKYDLSKDTVARYLRIYQLIDKLKVRLDTDAITIRIAVTLSYLRKSEQHFVEKILACGTRISIMQANELRNTSKKGELDEAAIKKVFEPDFIPAKVKPIKFSGEFLSNYFFENQSAEEIQSEVAEALKQYFARKIIDL
jgi:ParB family chromosome partitioning protein